MTIKEFAEEIGVSPTTVSRAMHGTGRISEATRHMVKERMAELGFTPNLNAQRLSRGQTNLVALDFGVWRDYLADMFFAELTRDLQDELEARGYAVLLSGPGDVVSRWVRTSAVDGVILIGEPPSRTVPEQIAATGTPCVVIANQPVRAHPGVGSVVVGLKSGAAQVAQLLVEHGHREIAYIGSQSPDPVLVEFAAELDRLGVALPQCRIAMAGATPRDGARALCNLITQSPQLTAVFARTDSLAAGALRAAHQAGIQVPDQFSIVGHDDVPLAELTEPPLTTVRVDCAELARLAADTLFALLKDPSFIAAPQTVETRLVVRGTVSARWPTLPDLSRGPSIQYIR